MTTHSRLGGVSARAAVGAAIAMSAVACGNSAGTSPSSTVPIDVGSPPATVDQSASVSTVVVIPSLAVATQSPAVATPTPFPRGYPKVVSVSSLPFQVKSWYQMGHYKKAVAVAPGVWTPLSPGASVQDAVTGGGLDGFCASIKAYERKYLNGEEEGGTCW